ncbi:MAG: hypothetical protein V4628_12830 [Pseudomonadota bacterium]
MSRQIPIKMVRNIFELREIAATLRGVGGSLSNYSLYRVTLVSPEYKVWLYIKNRDVTI